MNNRIQRGDFNPKSFVAVRTGKQSKPRLNPSILTGCEQKRQ